MRIALSHVKTNIGSGTFLPVQWAAIEALSGAQDRLAERNLLLAGALPVSGRGMHRKQRKEVRLALPLRGGDTILYAFGDGAVRVPRGFGPR